MRTKNGASVLFGVLALTAAAGTSCRSLPDCSDTRDGSELYGFLCPTGATSSGMTGSGGAGGNGSGGDGGGVVVPPECIPSDNSEPVASDCGVFVSSSMGSDDKAGTKEEPVKTLAAAVALAATAGKPVYACAEELMEEAGVDVPAGLVIYGGLDCTKAWAYAGDSSKTSLTALADAIPLRLQSGKGTTQLEDVHVLAAAAVLPSGSSIAVLVDSVSASFARSVLEASDAMAGAEGLPYENAAASGGSGNNGSSACTGSSVPGANASVNLMCGEVISYGGNGGDGLTASGANGASGMPDYSGNGGAGEGGSICKLGGKGIAGTDGTDGEDGVGLGSIDSKGYTGAAGADGVAGTVGQGGGGGGGSKGGFAVCANSTVGGASGGSGGAGGCGGAGGKGGGYGGSSIVVVSLGATLSFEGTQLVAKGGGNGGLGAEGQLGGAGGLGGSGGPKPSTGNGGCAGGKGADGGTGGQGGDGIGGHSLGIAFTGTAPPAEGVTITLGAPGAGGGMANPGVAAETQEFP